MGENRYSTEVKAGKLLLSTRVDASTTVTAWLEENPQQPRRPIARFQVDSLNRATNPGAIPPTTSSDETEGTPANVPAATPDPIRSGYRVPSVAPQLPPTFRR